MADLTKIGGVAYGRIDTVTDAKNTVDWNHHQIHEGDSFHISVRDSDLDTDAELKVAFKTPNTTIWGHCRVKGSNTVNGEFKFLEAATVTADTGSQISITNRNRNSATTSGMLDMGASATANKATLGATVTDDGTVIYQELLGAYNAKAETGEFVLKKNTVYVARIIGNADNGRASLHMDWDEHADVG